MRKKLLLPILFVLALLMCSCGKPRSTDVNTTTTPTESEAPTTTAEPELPTEPPIRLSDYAVEASAGLYDLSSLAEIDGLTLKCASWIDDSHILLVYLSGDYDSIYLYSLSTENGVNKELHHWDGCDMTYELQYLEIVSADPVIICDQASQIFYVYDPNTGGDYVISPYADSDTHYTNTAGNHGLYAVSLDSGAIEYVDRNNTRTVVWEPQENAPYSFTSIIFASDDGRYLICYGTDIYTLSSGYYVLDTQTGMPVGHFSYYSSIKMLDDMIYSMDYNDGELVWEVRQYDDPTNVSRYNVPCEQYPSLFEPQGDTIWTGICVEDSVVLSQYSLQDCEQTYSASLTIGIESGCLFSREFSISPDSSKLVFVAGIWDSFDRVYMWVPSESFVTHDFLGCSTYEDPQDYSFALSEWSEDDEITLLIREIYEKHGINVICGEDVRVDFGDYVTATCSDRFEIIDSLNSLAHTLNRYPEGFFEYLVSDYYLSGINIYLTGKISPAADTSIDNAAAFANTISDYQIIAMDITCYSDEESTIYHEFSHAIYNRITFEENRDQREYFDENYFFTLNPPGFEYYYSYLDENGNGYDWVGSSVNTGSDYYLDYDLNNVYFVDTYSKTYPTEDLARLLEYAMPEGYQLEYMQSPHIRAKLDYYCDVISEMWGIEFRY